MYKLQEVKLKSKKSLRVSLVSVFGVGNSRAKYICDSLGFGKNFNIHKLNKNKFQNLNELLKDLYIFGERLKVIKNSNVKKLKSRKTYKGLRHKLNLPLRGQRTHTNARTNKKKKY